MRDDVDTLERLAPQSGAVFFRLARVELAGERERGQHGRAVRDGVADEGDGLTQAEEDPAEHRSTETRRVLTRFRRRPGVFELDVRDDRGQGGGGGGTENRVADAVDHRHDQDYGPRDGVERDADGEEGQHDRANAVHHHHGAAPIEAVRQRSGRKPHGERRQHRRGPDDAGDRRRVGQRQDQQGVGERAELGAEVREDLTRPEQAEIAIAPQRDGRRLGRSGHGIRGVAHLGATVLRSARVGNPVPSATSRWRDLCRCADRRRDGTSSSEGPDRQESDARQDHRPKIPQHSRGFDHVRCTQLPPSGAAFQSMGESSVSRRQLGWWCVRRRDRKPRDVARAAARAPGGARRRTRVHSVCRRKSRRASSTSRRAPTTSKW